MNETPPPIAAPNEITLTAGDPVVFRLDPEGPLYLAHARTVTLERIVLEHVGSGLRMPLTRTPEGWRGDRPYHGDYITELQGLC